MDFAWDSKQLDLKEAVVKFAGRELNRDVIKKDSHGTFPRNEWKKCAEFGVHGLPFPQEYGGINADITTTMLLMEGLGYGCRDSGLIFAINAQMWSVQMPIFRFGSDEQKKKYLPGLCKGDIIGAHGMSEPDAGSDAFSLSTTATRIGDRYILNGVKTFVTNAQVADIFVVFATTNKQNRFMGITAFILDKGFKGLSISKNIEKMGLKTAPMAEVIMSDCEVPVANLLGKAGNGAAIFNDAIEWERACILAGHVGGMERQLEACIAYAKMRKQYGKPIGQFQLVAKMIVDMKVRMEAARLLLYKVAWLKQDKGKAAMEAAIAKLFISEAWVKSCRDAMQIHGGYGYSTEYEFERDMRDSLGGTIYSGTSEIQRNIIARYLGF
jgi:alkylation response protein AidB-like acyl-CoA dehydrogenase